jgi:hypothetical protein
LTAPRGLGGLAFVLFGVACGKSSGVVEAPMMSAQASASALSLVGNAGAGPAREGTDVPFRDGDRWSGTYTCRQGKTDMVIIFDEVSRRSPRSAGNEGAEESVDVDATFEFHFGGRPGFPAVDGSARMRGTYEVKSRNLRLKSEEWIDQPQGYGLVNLVGSISAPSGRGPSVGAFSHQGAFSPQGALTYSGHVEGPGCSSFSANPDPGIEMAPNSERSTPGPTITRSFSIRTP